MTALSRRSLLGGFAGLLAAPAIVKASSLMAVKPLPGIPYSIDCGYGVCHFEAPAEWHRLGAFNMDALIRGVDVLMVVTSPTETETVVWYGIERKRPKVLARADVPIKWEWKDERPSAQEA